MWTANYGWMIFGGLWVFYNMAIPILLVSRIPMEDRVMKAQFKEQWDEWAKKTPYRLVPFIY